MATSYNHVQMGIVDSSGNVKILYPSTTGKDVSVTPNANNSGKTVQDVVSALGNMAFLNTSDVHNIVELYKNPSGFGGPDTNVNYTLDLSSKNLNQYKVIWVYGMIGDWNGLFLKPVLNCNYNVVNNDPNFNHLSVCTNRYMDGYAADVVIDVNFYTGKVFICTSYVKGWLVETNVILAVYGISEL